SAEIRKAEAILLHLRWTQAKAQEAEAKSALAQATTLVGDRAAAQMQAAKDQAVGAHKLPELREAEAAAAAALQRLTIAKAQIEEEANRMRARNAELEKRLAQLDADIAREEQLVRDNADVLERLDAEERALNTENAGAAEREAQTRAAFEEAQAHLAASEAALAKVTSERAEASAARGQIERTLRETGERRDRLQRQLAEIDREAADIAQRIAALADPAEKRVLVDEAEAKANAAEAGAVEAEKIVAEARAAE